MTIREVKEFLNRGYYANKEIQNLKERLARLWQEINNAVPAYESDGVQFNPDVTSKAKKLAVYEDSKDVIEQKILELEKLDNEIELIIQKVNDGKLRTILRMRHIDRKSWRQIEREMHFARRTIFYTYDEALEAVRDILEARK